MSKPKALDLFCGAGGGTKGLQRAGFYVVGVDIKPQPRYCGDEFVQADAMEYPLDGYDFIWASPPCQGYTLMNNRYPEQRGAHPQLIEPIRRRLRDSGIPFVIENVVGSPLLKPLRLCGSQFGLGVVRHRLFEVSPAMPFLIAPCSCRGMDHAGVYGQHPDGGRLWNRADGHAPLRRALSLEDGAKRMGIDWMEWHELTQAIPPAYSEFIGKQALEVIGRESYKGINQ